MSTSKNQSILSFIIVSLFSILFFANTSQAQVDPSAYANGVKAILEFNSKGEITGLKMAPPRFKTQLHRVAVNLKVENNRLKMEPLGIINDTLIYIYIRQPLALSSDIARALKISNPNEAKLSKGMITINKTQKKLDLATVKPLKMEGRN